MPTRMPDGSPLRRDAGTTTRIASEAVKWAEGLREVQPEAILHPSVLERLAAKDGVQHYYELAPYRPANLAAHSKLGEFYPDGDGAARQSTTSEQQASQ